VNTQQSTSPGSRTHDDLLGRARDRAESSASRVSGVSRSCSKSAIDRVAGREHLVDFLERVLLVSRPFTAA